MKSKPWTPPPPNPPTSPGQTVWLKANYPACQRGKWKKSASDTFSDRLLNMKGQTGLATCGNSFQVGFVEGLFTFKQQLFSCSSARVWSFWSEAFRGKGSTIQVQRCPKSSFTPQMSQKHADVNWVCRGSPCLKGRERQADGRKTERKTITDRNQYWRGESNPFSQLFRRLWRQICSDGSGEKCESTPR